jgi:hypothetical protein
VAALAAEDRYLGRALGGDDLQRTGCTAALMAALRAVLVDLDQGVEVLGFLALPEPGGQHGDLRARVLFVDGQCMLGVRDRFCRAVCLQQRVWMSP